MSRVAVFIPGISGGGAERFSTLLAGGLIEYGHEVFMLTGEPQESEYNLDSRVHRVILVHGQRGIIAWSRALRQRLQEFDVDICVAVGIAPNLIASMIAGKNQAKVVICERNAPKQDSISKKSRIARWLLYRRADFFVFQTSGAREFYSRDIQARSVVIPNPVIPGLPVWEPRGRHEIASVGRLMPQKNYPLMLQSFAIAYARNPDWTLRIFGKGSFLSEYEALAKKLNVSEAVRFEGFQADVHKQIAECEMFLMTSDFEGMPNALLEAMAMGMPCVSTDCPAGGPAMLINNGFNGLLCPVGDAETIALTVQQLMRDEDARRRIGMEARRTADEYSLGCVMEQWNHLIRKLELQ